MADTEEMVEITLPIQDEAPEPAGGVVENKPKQAGTAPVVEDSPTGETPAPDQPVPVFEAPAGAQPAAPPPPPPVTQDDIAKAVQEAVKPLAGAAEKEQARREIEKRKAECVAAANKAHQQMTKAWEDGDMAAYETGRVAKDAAFRDAEKIRGEEAALDKPSDPPPGTAAIPPQDITPVPAAADSPNSGWGNPAAQAKFDQWIATNAWFKHPDFTEESVAAVQFVQSLDVLQRDPASDSYYKDLDAHLRKRFPKRANKKQTTEGGAATYVEPTFATGGGSNATPTGGAPAGQTKVKIPPATLERALKTKRVKTADELARKHPNYIKHLAKAVAEREAITPKR